MCLDGAEKASRRWNILGVSLSRFQRVSHIWTDEQRRYLLRHRTDGTALLSHVLGHTEDEIQAEANRIGFEVPKRRLDGGEICPMCGTYEVRPDTVSGRNGVCPVCWERMKAKAMEERAATLRAQRDYDAAKKRCRNV
jgi:hypothetical protein